MKSNSKFSISLHVLAHLAEQPGRCVTSEELAACVHTHPVVIRRTLASLRQAGVVASLKGHGGGWSLARPAAAISLRDVYAAVNDPALFSVQRPRGRPDCAIESTISHVLDDFFHDAEALLMDRLGGISLADLAADFHRRMAEHQDLACAARRLAGEQGETL
jgi:Rrf2 family protein